MLEAIVPGFWKLERQQTFKEPGDEGWRAFADGRWEESLRIWTRPGPRRYRPPAGVHPIGGATGTIDRAR
ncbi:hypothetical protein [Micromonospora haikouensis]|uniref:hypothetical protein n=1 Tax=Micromonospora haikouensis TaxID=686309 RepID=UPI003D735642